MKQLYKPGSTKLLKTPGMPKEHKMTCKALANLVLVALSFSRGSQGLEKQLSSQELERLMSCFLKTLGVGRKNQLGPYKPLQQASSWQLVWGSSQPGDLTVCSACKGPSLDNIGIQQELIVYLVLGIVLVKMMIMQGQRQQERLAWVCLVLITQVVSFYSCKKAKL